MGAIFWRPDWNARREWPLGSRLTLVVLMAALGSGCENRSPAPAPAGSSSSTSAYLLGADHGQLEVAVERRFSGTIDPIARARAEFKAGETATALDLLNSLPSDFQIQPQWAALHGEVQKAEDGIERKSAVEDVAFRIRTYWEPELLKRPTTIIQTADAVWGEETFLESMAGNLADNLPEDGNGKPLPLDASGKKARAEFRQHISARQVKVLPLMRKAYVRILAARLWPDNVIVTSQGKTINFTGSLFADNGSIQETEQTAEQDLEKLRFTRAHYAWCGGCGGYTYTLAGVSDAAVDRWDGTSFKPVG